MNRDPRATSDSLKLPLLPPQVGGAEDASDALGVRYHSANRNEALLDISQLLLEGHSEVLTDAILILVEALGCAGGALFMQATQAPGEHATLITQRGLPPALEPALERSALVDKNFLVCRAIGRKRTIVEPNMMASGGPAIEPIELLHARWVVGVATPIVVARRAIGALLVAARSEMFGPQDFVFIETVANLIGLALERRNCTELRPLAPAELQAPSTARPESQTPSEGGPAPEVTPDEELESYEDERWSLTAMTSAICSTIQEKNDEATVTKVRSSMSDASPPSRAPRPADLSAICSEIVMLIAPRLRSRGVALDATIEPGCAVGGQAEALSRFILALLQNAADLCEASERAARVVKLRVARRDRIVHLLVAAPKPPFMPDADISPPRGSAPDIDASPLSLAFNASMIRQGVESLGGSATIGDDEPGQVAVSALIPYRDGAHAERLTAPPAPQSSAHPSPNVPRRRPTPYPSKLS